MGRMFRFLGLGGKVGLGGTEISVWKGWGHSLEAGLSLAGWWGLAIIICKLLCLLMTEYQTATSLSAKHTLHCVTIQVDSTQFSTLFDPNVTH